MSMTEIRSIVVSTQETLRESGTSVSPATVKVIAAATKQPIRMLLDDAPACTTGTVVAAAVGV